MKLAPRDEIIVGVMAILLIVVILVVVLVRPQFAELGKIQTMRQEQEGNIRNAQAELDRLKAYKSEALQVQADLIKVGNQVPESPQLPSLVVQIQDLANESGIEFSSITPQQMTASGEYTTLPVNLALSGRFFDVVDFMYRLEHLTREVRVTNVDLSAELNVPGGGQQDKEKKEDQLVLGLTANVFVMGTVPGAQTPQQKPGAAPAPSAAPK